MTTNTSTSARTMLYSLFAILGLALFLRVWGIAFGLPYDLTADEPHEIIRALKLGAGEYSWFPGKGGLYFFLFVEYGFLYVIWWLTGRVANPNDFALAYLQDPTAFYLAGRWTVAIMGTITCWVAYQIGRRLYDWRVGLLAALIGATAYHHAYWSHYVSVDVGLALAIWASVLSYLRYEEDGRLRWLVVAGVFAGIGIAFKLPGGALVPILLLAIATPRAKWSAAKRVLKEGATLVAATIVTVVTISPENVDLGQFTYHFTELFEPSAAIAGTAETAEAAEAAEAAAETVAGEGPALFAEDEGRSYFVILLQPVNLALTLAALAGVVIGLRNRSRWSLLSFAFVLLFLAGMSLGNREGQARYMFPILPALWLLAASAIAAIPGWRLRAAAVAAVIALPLANLVYADVMWTRPDTRILAKQWIESNAPHGSKILMDGLQYRFIHAPPLNPDEVAVARRLGRMEEQADQLSRGVSGRMLSLYAEAMSRMPGPKYDLYSTDRGRRIEDLSYYTAACFDYLVTSDRVSRRFANAADAERFPKSAAYYRELPSDHRFELVYSASPIPWKIQGPTIAVYKVLHCGNLHSSTTH